MNALYTIIFVTLCFGLSDNISKDERQAYGQSLQFVTCLVAVYMHVPLVLAHVSLAFPSALVWSASIAFAAFPIQSEFWQKIKRPVVLAVALLSLVLVPNKLFGEFTPFVTTVFLPLHMLISMLWLI
jgi:hypothetical protein